MLRTILCLLALAGPVSAQSTAAVPMPASRFTATDTVRAIHRLFAQHRRTGGIVAASAVGAAVVGAGVLAANEGSPPSFGFGGFLLVNTILSLPFIGYGLEQNLVYDTRREARIVDAYQSTHQLPAKIRRKLRKQLLHV